MSDSYWHGLLGHASQRRPPTSVPGGIPTHVGGLGAQIPCASGGGGWWCWAHFSGPLIPLPLQCPQGCQCHGSAGSQWLAYSQSTHLKRSKEEKQEQSDQDRRKGQQGTPSTLLLTSWFVCPLSSWVPGGESMRQDRLCGEEKVVGKYNMLHSEAIFPLCSRQWVKTRLGRFSVG